MYGCTTTKGIEVKSSETSYTIKWRKTGMWRWRCGLNECTHQGNEGSLTSDKSLFSFLPAVLTTWNGKTATWFTHEYIKNDSILSVYISICILKTPCIKSFSGPHTGITADNLHHAANIHTTTGWRLDSGKKNKLIKKRNHNIGFGSVYSILFRKFY